MFLKHVIVTLLCILFLTFRCVFASEIIRNVPAGSLLCQEADEAHVSLQLQNIIEIIKSQKDENEIRVEIIKTFVAIYKKAEQIGCEVMVNGEKFVPIERLVNDHLQEAGLSLWKVKAVSSDKVSEGYVIAIGDIDLKPAPNEVEKILRSND